MRVNGVELNVVEVGEGRPFLWAHGLMGSVATDDAMTELFQWPMLAAQTRLVRYDARGHGRSAASADFDDFRYPQLSRDMLAVADANGIDRFVAGGQSMGSATALYTALAAPKRVAGLVLMNPPTAWETRKAQAAMYAQMADIIEARGLEKLAAQLKSITPTPTWLFAARPDLANALAQGMASHDSRVLPLILRGAGRSDLPPLDDIRALAVPTLILAWEGDPTHPISTAEALHRSIATARLEVASNLDQLATWPRAIREFVAALK